ncbi:MAG: signal peptidase I [Candidatus Dormiibacterota bacterium]
MLPQHRLDLYPAPELGVGAGGDPYSHTQFVVRGDADTNAHAYLDSDANAHSDRDADGDSDAYAHTDREFVVMAAQIAAEPAKRRRNPAVRTAEWILAVVVIVLVVVAIFLAVSIRHSSTGQTTFFGRPVYSVASGSMTPTFDTGDLIIDRSITGTAAEHLQKGQIITFTATQATSGSSSIVITHRIYAVVRGPLIGGVRTVEYRTKGDANNAPDQDLVQPSAILGVYQQRVPFGGYVLSTLHQPITFIVLIMIPVAYLVEEEVRRRWVRLGEEAAQRRSAANRPGDLW